MVFISCLQEQRDGIDLLEGDYDFEEPEMTVVEESPAKESEDPLSGITLQSLVGFTYPKTMKMGGTMYEKDVVILIDFGATSNFISTSVAQQLRLPLSNVPCLELTWVLGRRFLVTTFVKMSRPGNMR